MNANSGSGFTMSERLLGRLCQNSFLTMWSYSNLFNHRGLCDENGNIVAHGAAKQCQKVLGGSGSLALNSTIVGDNHCLKSSEGGRPFEVGKVNPAKGFIHVFDDTTLPLVLSQLDTVADFVAYLEKKEQFFTSGKHIVAAGEEEVLAQYLKKINSESEHDFVLPEEAKQVEEILFEEGIWRDFQSNPQRLNQIEADKISYFWDELIERFTHHAINGTSEWQSEPGLQTHETALRFLAKESRLRRRYLTNAFVGIVLKAPVRATRVVTPYLPDQPHYVFLVAPQPHSTTYRQYREYRRGLLWHYCNVVKFDFPNAKHIIGIATEVVTAKDRSEDLAYLDATKWTTANQKEARDMKRFLQNKGLLRTRSGAFTSIDEYPDSPMIPSPLEIFRPAERMNGNNRNSPCPCGSHKKYKKCCGLIT